MPQIFVSNGGDAANPMSGGGNAAGLLNGLKQIGVDATAVKLKSAKTSPVQALGSIFKNALYGMSWNSLYFTPRGQQLAWPFSIPPGCVLIDFFQISPTEHLARRDFQLYRFIDMTLFQFFSYSENSKIKDHQKIFELEKLSYSRADKIFCCTEWARQSVINDYDINLDKVSVLRSGANISENILLDNFLRPSNVPTSLKLLFIGVDWRRKGLEKLSEAVGILNANGIESEIVALGPAPNEVSHLKHVISLGLFKKSERMPEFIRLMTDSAFGALWSTAEGLPNSLLEALAFGVPVLTSAIPPIKSGLEGSASIMLDINSTATQIALEIERLWITPGAYEALRSKAKSEWSNFTWTRSSKEISSLIENYAGAIFSMEQPTII